jgi:hypothetical protein
VYREVFCTDLLVVLRNKLLIPFLCLIKFLLQDKLPSTQLFIVIVLMWRHVSTSEDHLQSSGTKYIKRTLYNCIVTIVPAFFFFFFFYWHYNPLCVLAFSVILFHSALSSHSSLHRLIPIICIIFFNVYNPSLR